MSTGVSYGEQLVYDLERLSKNFPSVPVMIVLVDMPLDSDEFMREDREEVRRIQNYCSLDYLQFHGHEGPAYCQQFSRREIKAFRIQKEKDLDVLADYSCLAYLLDTFVKDQIGGTGKTFDWRLAKSAKSYGRIILSGGLTPDNVRQAIRFVCPYAVDTSSGVEMYPGKKDHAKLSSFFDSVASVDDVNCSSPVSKG